MILPLVLSILAILSAAVMSYGVHPGWARYDWGVDLIMLTRRFQWPLVAVSLIVCLGLVGLVIGGKRRAWWLIALGPVLVLFIHRFLIAPVNRFSATEVTLVGAEQAGLDAAEPVIGVVLNDQACAYPCAMLNGEPVSVYVDRDKQLLLMWSRRANGATAMLIERSVRARQLDIVSDPADSLLIYNTRSGEFVVALTGRTPDGRMPRGFESDLHVAKVTWRQWRSLYPETKVALSRRAWVRSSAPGVAPGQGVALIGVGAPLAVRSGDIAEAPINATAGDVPVVIFRDPSTGSVRAFDRRLEKDLIPNFASRRDPEKKTVFMVDSDTGAVWSTSGVAVDGDRKFRGHKLRPVLVQEDVSWPAVKFWMPKIKLLEK